MYIYDILLEELIMKRNYRKLATIIFTTLIVIGTMTIFNISV